ncbi:MAG: exodeoxyribonuclease VII large subunit [Cytophagales bacterium]|nr:exodeoxyribonuclease VII large subunit [Bernardetiaceae bacterium]MDW8205161.1 exodeoxyribonuclease VII large subunit [Cytophagales bacterium]
MQEKLFTLLQLNKSIRNLIAGINREFWIVAEIAHIHIQEHAYLELVQKENDRIVAKARGIIWSPILQQLLTEHSLLASSILKAGTSMRCRVAVNFHEIHGLSLHINAVDTAYSLGEMERQRLAILAKLEKAGYIHLQQQLGLPPAIQKIAVVSSENAAGLGDFIHQLRNNPWKYGFLIRIFPAYVQGDNAIPSLIEQISKVDCQFDVLAIIRGGGARLDLEVFNTEAVALAVARCPVPVLTGIGHQRDITIADRCAYLALKTPTAVAEYILQHNLQFENEILALIQKISLHGISKINEEKYWLSQQKILLMRKAYEKIQQEKLVQQKIAVTISIRTKNKLHDTRQKIQSLEQFFRLSDPKYLLKKGYFLIKHQQQYLTSHQLEENMQIEIEGGHALFEAYIQKKHMQ